MKQPHKILPQKLNADLDPQNLKSDEARYLLNIEKDINNATALKPVLSNYTDFDTELLPRLCTYTLEIPLGTTGSFISHVVDGEEVTTRAAGTCVYTVSFLGYSPPFGLPFSISYRLDGVVTNLPGTYNLGGVDAVMASLGWTSTGALEYSITTEGEANWEAFYFTVLGSPTTFEVDEACNLELSVDDDLTALGFTMISSGVWQITSAEIWQSYSVGIKGVGEAWEYNVYDFSVICSDELVGTNICIGSFYHRSLNQFFWFNYNTEARHHILMYDANTEDYFKIVETPLLNFTLQCRIPSCFLVPIYGEDGTQDRLLYWTERMDGSRIIANPIRKLNIDQALTGELWDTSSALLHYRTADQWMRHDKYQPSLGINLLEVTEPSNEDFYNQQVRQKRFQFGYRFLYLDGEPSVPFTHHDLIQVTSNADAVLLYGLSAGSRDVKSVQLMYREGNSGDWRIFETLERDDILANASYQYDFGLNTFQLYFANNKAYSPAPPNQVTKNYDNTPIRCGTIELLTNNKMTCGNVLMGYDNLPLEDIRTPDLNVTYTSFTDYGVPMRKVTGYVIIHNLLADLNQAIHLIPDDISVYGGLSLTTVRTDLNTDWEQVCSAGSSPTKKGFTVYSAGTPWHATTKQGIYDPSDGSFIEIDSMLSPLFQPIYANVILSGKYFVHKYELELPAGRHILRICDPRRADFGSTDYQNTSMPLLGTVDINGYLPTATVSTDGLQEIYVDTTSGNVDLTNSADPTDNDVDNPANTLNRVFVVVDLPDPDDTNISYAQTGYLSNTSGSAAVELALLNPTIATLNTQALGQTDHNGFFWFCGSDASGVAPYSYTFTGEYNNPTTPQTLYSRTGVGTADVRDEEDALVSGTLAPNYDHDSESFVTGNFAEGNLGFAGQPVVIARGAWGTTSSTGTFSVPFHNDAQNLGGLPSRTLKLYYPHGAVPISWSDYTTGNDFTCPITDVDINELQVTENCAGSIYNADNAGQPKISGTFDPPVKFCDLNPPTNYPITITPVPYVLAQLKQGGLYRFGFILRDESGKQTFVQFDEKFILNTPFITQVAGAVPAGHKVIELEWDWNSLIFPDWVYDVQIVRTKNTFIQRDGWGGFLQTRITELTFTDAEENNLNATPSAADRIYFTIQGQNQFNTVNYFNTTTGYTWTPNDRVRFILNADGTYFTGASIGSVNAADYQLRSSDSISFAIDNNPALYDLQVGALIEIFAPRNQTDTDIYYEITGKLPTTRVQGNNQAVTQIVPLPTFDTYFIDRAIPADPQAGSYSPILVEHHSQYDTVVDSNGEDIGRINVINPSARQVYKGWLQLHSNAFLPDGDVNGLSTFDPLDEKVYPLEAGAITKLKCIDDTLHVICEDKVYYVKIGKQQATLGDGTEQLYFSGKTFSDPFPVLGLYGCQDPETFVTDRYNVMRWLDVKRGCAVQYEGNVLKAISDEGLKNYFHDQCEYARGLQPVNGSELFVWSHGGYDPLHNRYMLTQSTVQVFDRGETLVIRYTNNEQALATFANFTLGYSNAWDSFYGFTGEYYGLLDGSIHGSEFITFKNGIPYFHNDNRATTYDTFYGTQVDQVLEIVCNPDAKVKNFQSFAVDSKKPNSPLAGIGYDVVNVGTAEGMQSKIPIGQFVWKEGVYWSNFFRDTTLGGSLSNGRPLKSTYATLRLVRDTSRRTEYNEIRQFIFFTSPSLLTV